MGFGGRLIDMFSINVVSKEKYDFLEQKYWDLVNEFRQYRAKSELIERRLKREVKALNESVKISSEIQDILILNANLSTKHREEIKKLEGKKSKSIFL
jgi:translation initiation factor IF-2